MSIGINIQIFDGGISLSPFEFLAVIMILLALVITIGYRNNARKIQYWAIAVVEALTFSGLWLFLALMTELAVWTHFSLLPEEKVIVINILDILTLIGFCILLAFVEIRVRAPKSSNSA